jgi:hypothetical protein
VGKAASTEAVTVAGMAGVGSGVGVAGGEVHPASARIVTRLRIAVLIPK